jgi:hypothetical protein
MKQAARALCIVVASVALAGGGVACQAFFGVDPSEDASNGSDDQGSGGRSGASSSGAGSTTSCSCLAPPAGDGWDGPFHVGEYAPGLGPTSCPGGDPARRLYVGHQAASCGTCACGAVTGASCPTQVLCYPSTNCTGTPTDQAGMFAQGGEPDSCYLWSAPNPYSCRVVQDPATGGGCEVQSGAPTPAGWQSERVLCPAPIGDGCDEGDICAAADAGGQVCYTNMADVMCPQGWDAPYVGYTGLQGELACSGCSCASPTGVGCSTAQYAFYAVSLLVCHSQVSLASGCANVSGLNGYSSLGAPAPNGGSCVASGGIASSAPTPTGYTSVCCKTL